MASDPRIARKAALALALLVASPIDARPASVNFKADFYLHFDCERPFFVRNHPIHAVFTGVLNTDRSASADLAISGILFTNHVRFDARLGGSQPTPGGSSSLRVIASNHIRAIWDLPNNQLILDILNIGGTCSSHLDMKFKPNMTEYTMFDGHNMYYCSKQELLRSSCEAN